MDRDPEADDQATYISSVSEAVWDPDRDDAAPLPSFTQIRRGYDPRQVDSFIQSAMQRLRGVEAQLNRLRAGTDASEQEALARRLADAESKAADAEALASELMRARSRLADLQRLETELAQARAEAERAAGLEAQLSSTRADLDRVLEERAKPDAYGSLANQVADLLRSAGIQADQVRREADEEARRQLDEATAEADSIRREAQRDADAVRRGATAESERVSTERDEILTAAQRDAEVMRREATEEAERATRAAQEDAERIRREATEEAEAARRDAFADSEALRREARAMADRVVAERDEMLREARNDAEAQVGNAQLEAGRIREDAERTLRKARADAERIVGAALSRREVVLAELTTMRERLRSSIELLETAMQPVSEDIAARFREASDESDVESDLPDEHAEDDSSSPAETAIDAEVEDAGSDEDGS